MIVPLLVSTPPPVKVTVPVLFRVMVPALIMPLAETENAPLPHVLLPVSVSAAFDVIVPPQLVAMDRLLIVVGTACTGAKVLVPLC